MTDVVAEDLFPAPLLERLLRAERVAEVDGAGEVLLGAVEAVRGKQLLRPEDAEGIEQLGPDLVLAAVAAGRRHQRDANSLVPRVQRKHRVVLIVGVGCRVDEGAGRFQPPQRQGQGGRAVEIRYGRDSVLRCRLLGADAKLQGGGDGADDQNSAHSTHRSVSGAVRTAPGWTGGCGFATGATLAA